MSKTITELTEAQKAEMPRYVEKYIKIGANTERLDYDEAYDIVNDVRTELLGLPKAPVVIVDDPTEAWVACNYHHYHGITVNELPKKLDEFFSGKKIELEAFSMPNLCGSFDVAIHAFYAYNRDVLGLDYGEHAKKYQIWHDTIKLGLIFPFDGLTIVSQKPTVIKLTEQAPIVCHCDGGPAIEYAGRGGYKIFMLNGVRVPEWLAVTHSSQIPLSRYTELSNADVKMEFIRKVGVERMLHYGHKVDDYTKYNHAWWTKSQYELWDMSKIFDGVPFAPHLKMLNQTTGVWHVEAVSPACKNLEAAIRERLGGDFDLQGIA